MFEATPQGYMAQYLGYNYIFTRNNMKLTGRKALGAKKTPGMENLQPDPQNVYTPEKDDEQRFSHPTTLSHFSLRPRTAHVENSKYWNLLISYLDDKPWPTSVTVQGKRPR